MNQRLNIFWYRRDLRLHDNAALYHALQGDCPVLPIFIFDKHILSQLDDKKDDRVTFIQESISALYSELSFHGSSLEVFNDYPEEVFKTLLSKYDIAGVYTNHDYEPYARQRDEAIRRILNDKGVAFHTYKDQVIFEKDEVTKDDGNPYVVFTPYSKRWIEKLNTFYVRSYPVEKYLDNLHRFSGPGVPALEQIGFEKSIRRFPPVEPPTAIIRKYAQQRDFPALDGTSRLGVHLRFGTISIRKVALVAKEHSEVFLRELIWRDFYQMILWQFPRVGQGRAFKKEYENIKWRNDEQEFSRWCEGQTGYPIVDAGMRQLNETGFMHNRVRMITASFLTKHLLIDWRWGEAYFAQKLLDYDLASNNGGWQWAAGCGCDAAPYFRVFNPTIQAKKFDSDHAYIRKWVPEYDSTSYPQPMVDHDFARKRCLEVYSRALKQPL